MQSAKSRQILPGTAPLLILALMIGTCLLNSACVTNRKTYDSQGILVDEQMIYKKPFWDRD